MNLYSTTPTSSPIELQPAGLFGQGFVSTGVNTNAAAPAAQTAAVVQTETACSVKKGSSLTSRGKSCKGNHANRINRRPYSDCQRHQQKWSKVNHIYVAYVGRKGTLPGLVGRVKGSPRFAVAAEV
ncbi:hypothetical protein ACEPAG_4874 [Sanghuangporus baumii]